MPNQPKPPTICPICKSPVNELKGISRKTGRSYHFWACQNRNCEFRWNPPSQTELRHQEIMRALRIIYAQLKKMEAGITEPISELPNISDEEIPIIEEQQEKDEQDRKKSLFEIN
jgi:hypothetical protein